jgi:hypothetical protein
VSKRGRPAPVTIRDFSHGLDARGAAWPTTATTGRLLEGVAAFDLRNLEPGPNGTARRRRGSIQAGSFVNKFWTLQPMRDEQVILEDSNGAVSTVATTLVSPTARSGAPFGSRKWIMAPSKGGQGPYYGTGTAQALQMARFSGAVGTWTASAGTLPTGTYLIYHGNRAWFGNLATYGGTIDDPTSTIIGSAPGDVRDYAAPVIVSFSPGDGDDISGLAPIGEQMLVFKRRSCYVVYDLETGANRQLSDRIGAAVEGGIVPTPYGVAFVGQDDFEVYLTDGSRIDKISEPLGDAFRAESEVIGLRGAYRDGHLYLTLTDQRTSNVVLGDFDMATKRWLVHQLAPRAGDARPLWIYEIASQGDALLAATDSVGGGATPYALMHLLDDDAPTFADGSASFSSYWRSPVWGFGDIAERKRMRAVELYGTGEWGLDVYNEQNLQLATYTGLAPDVAAGGEAGPRAFLDPGVAHGFSLNAAVRSSANLPVASAAELHALTAYIQLR